MTKMIRVDSVRVNRIIRGISDGGVIVLMLLIKKRLWLNVDDFLVMVEIDNWCIVDGTVAFGYIEWVPECIL